MDQNEEKLQSVGICHRLFCFIMKTLAAQALKPVTLGPPVSRKQTQKRTSYGIDRWPQQSQGLFEKKDDSESLISIDIEDGTFPLLEAVRSGWYQDEGEVQVEMIKDCKTKAPKKVVSIKDEPEIINFSNKRRKTLSEWQTSMAQRELRPLRSILKVGSMSNL